MGDGKQQNHGGGRDDGAIAKGASPALADFAVALYANDDVKRACLDAQDTHGADVNLLLWAAWQAHRGHALSPSQLARADALCEDWRAGVVQPLREQRRRWAGQAAQAHLYDAVKALELQAEFTQLAMLAEVDVGSVDVAKPGPEDAAALLSQNLAALATHWTLAGQALARVVNALVATGQFVDA